MLFKRKRIPFIIPDDARELTDEEMILVNGGAEEKKESQESKSESVTVQSGNTLSGIVNDYNKANGTNYTVSEVAKNSGISNPHLIYPGQEIKFGSSNSSGSATSVQTSTQGTASTKGNYGTSSGPSSSPSYGNTSSSPSASSSQYSSVVTSSLTSNAAPKYKSTYYNQMVEKSKAQAGNDESIGASTKDATTCIHPKVKVYEQEALRSKELARELIASSSYCPKLPQKVSSDNIEKKSRTSGRWGTINNREALAMRMQDYRGTALNKMNGTHLEEIPKGSGNWEKVDNIFSKSGCLMQATAKLATEIKGEKVSLLDVNDKFDTNTDGNLSFEEIKSDLEDCLPEGKYLIAKEIKSVTKENFDNISDMGTNTFVIGKADDVAGGDHWINLGSYRMNEYNQVEFSYSPTSENDVNNHRRYVLGSILDGQENFHSISRVYTFTVCDSMLLMK